MTIDLAAAIAAQQAEWEAARAAKEAERAAKTAAHNAAQAAKREDLLRQYLGEELITQLQVRLEKPEHHGYGFVYDGVVYGLGVYPQQASLWALGDGSSAAFESPESFITALAALHSDERREQQQRQQAQAAERAAQLDTHARLQAQVDAAYEAAYAQRWQWPEGRKITLYRWSWCTAPATEYGSAQYDFGWSLGGKLGGDGWVVFEPERHRPERRLLLSPSCLPIASAQTFWDMFDIPTELREAETITLSGLRNDTNLSDADGEPLLVEQVGAELPIFLGEQPIAWVRALLD